MKDLVNMVGKGVTSAFAPMVFKGALLEIFRQKEVSTQLVTTWVLEDKSLWDILGTEPQRRCRQLGAKLGSMRWMTADWAIDALRKEQPALSSLFLGWVKGRNWLQRQLDFIKNECESGGVS